MSEVIGHHLPAGARLERRAVRTPTGEIVLWRLVWPYQGTMMGVELEMPDAHAEALANLLNEELARVQANSNHFQNIAAGHWGKVKDLLAALEPFATICMAKAERSDKMHKDLKMGQLTDRTTSGWGTTYGMLKKARDVFLKYSTDPHKLAVTSGRYLGAFKEPPNHLKPDDGHLYYDLETHAMMERKGEVWVIAVEDKAKCDGRPPVARDTISDPFPTL